MELTRWECVCLGYMIGSAILSTLTLAIALLSFARKGVFLTLSLVAVLVLWRLAPWFRRLQPSRIDSIPVFLRWAFGAAWIVYGVIYFRYALAPEVSPDGTAYHLGLVNLWSHAHGLYRIMDMYAAMPDGVEMLFLFAFSIGRHSAAALVHFSFLMLLPLMMILYGIRFGISRGGAAPCAAILVFVTPLVGWDGSVAYNDVALAAVVFASVYLLQMWRRDKRTGSLVACSLLAGYAFAIKYTGGFVLLLVMATVIWEVRREARRLQLKTLVITIAMMALTPLPYLVRNWMWFQDPIAFFGTSVFRNPNFHVSFEEGYIHGQVHLNEVTWSELPRELTLGGPKLGESLGPIYLLAPIAVLGLLWPESRFLVIAAATVGCAYLGNVSARFLIPVLPFVLMAMAFVLSRLPRAVWVLGALSVAQLVMSLPWVTKYTHVPNIPYPGLSQVSWDVALRGESEEHYLARQLDEYVMAREIESHVPKGETVFSLYGGFLQSYTTRFVMDLIRSADAEKFRDLLYSNWNSAKDARRRFTAVFPEARARQLLILQTANNPDMWSVSEIRLWHGNQLISPPAIQNLDAFPNPWDIGLAFDGVEATRWRSWEHLAPGMHIGVRFPSAQTIDRVDVLSNDSQWFSDMDIRILTEKGQWLCPLFARWQFDPPLDLRKEATAALKRQGIHYVLISQSASREEVFRNNLSAWGMHKVLSTKESTLYRID